MAEEKFTPGPWHVMSDSLTISEDCGIAIVECLERGTETHNPKANAHLIAAAPDLYAACTKTLARGCTCHSTTQEEWHANWCHIPTVRAALARARGQQ